MRAFILTVTLATAYSAAFAVGSNAPSPAPNALCPIQHSAVNASCPMIKIDGQDLRSCLPGLTSGSETSSRQGVKRERNGRNS